MTRAIAMVTLGILIFIFPAVLSMAVSTFLIAAGVSQGIRKIPPISKPDWYRISSVMSSIRK